MLRTSLVLLTGLLSALINISIASADEAHTPSIRPGAGCTEPERHQLDFWLGDWDTFEPEGALGPSQARAHVDSILSGCVVHELYEQIDGLIGDSFLSYDSITKRWQQTWLTNFGAYMFLT